MPPKKTAAKKAKNAVDEGPEGVLQAVIIADSFDNRFRPFTLEKPRCLLPLNNTPLLEYTLEFLAMSGVEEVFVYCCAHSELIDEYIEQSKWKHSASVFKVHCINTLSSMSVGDVMRDLDLKHLITTDFLLVQGDIVSNFISKDFLKAHLERRKKDSDIIMTMLLRDSSEGHRSTPRGETGIFFLDKTQTRCLHYEEKRATSRGGQYATIEGQLMKDHKQTLTRDDLIDCYVDVVAPDVPALFTENFDYQHLRRDFVHGILTDDLYGKKIYVHILQDKYCARVRSVQTYDAVSRDVIARWAYPVCPETNLLPGQTYLVERGNKYHEDNIVLSKGCQIGNNCVIGRSSTVGEGSIILNCSIGRNCNIGKNTHLSGVYIWDNVSIGDNCTMAMAILANGVAIGDDCTVDPGALISFDVVVAKNTHVLGDARLTTFVRKDEAPAITKARNEPDYFSPVGVGGTGYAYEDSDNEDEDEIDVIAQSGMVRYRPSTYESDSMSELSDDEDDAISRHAKSAHKAAQAKRGRRTSISSTTDGEGESNLPPEEQFYKEASTSLLNSLERSQPINVIALELNSLRMASNGDFNTVRRAAAYATCKRVDQLLESNSKLTSPAAVKQVFDYVLQKDESLIKRMVFEANDGVHFLECLTREATTGKILTEILTALYNDEAEVISEDIILTWWEKPLASEDKALEAKKNAAKGMIEFLQKDDSEEESDEEEEDEEASDDE